MTDQTIAKTILEQLGGNRFAQMTGAKNFVNLGEGLAFQLADRKINRVKVKLNGRDLYDVEFGQYRALEYKVKKTCTDVYAEDLQDVFTEATGLYTRL